MKPYMKQLGRSLVMTAAIVLTAITYPGLANVAIVAAFPLFVWWSYVGIKRDWEATDE